MEFKDIRCPFKIIKSKHIMKEDNEICITENVDFGFCTTGCIFCEHYTDSDYQIHFQKCKRL